MKKNMTILVLVQSAITVSAQEETFDFVTYTAPREPGKGNIENDLESEWNVFVAKTYNITGTLQASEAVDYAELNYIPVLQDINNRQLKYF